MISSILVLFLMVQAGPIPQQAPMKENRAPVPATPAPMQHAESADVDRTFAIAFTQASNAEMDFAHLAEKRASANEVKAYAAKMIAEHKGLSDEVSPLLQHVMTTPPGERLAPPDQLAFKHLESLKPVDFDQQYILSQIAGHLATLTAFQTEAQNGTNKELKEVIRKWTPTIQAHLELAVDVTKHVGGSSPFKQ